MFLYNTVPGSILSVKDNVDTLTYELQTDEAMSQALFYDCA